MSNYYPLVTTERVEEAPCLAATIAIRLKKLYSEAMKKDLVGINLLSKNSEKLIEFYTKVVGLSPLDTTKNPATDTWYGFDTGNTPFAIEPMSNRDKYSTTSEYNKSNPTLIQFKANSLEELTLHQTLGVWFHPSPIFERDRVRNTRGEVF